MTNGDFLNLTILLWETKVLLLIGVLIFATIVAFIARFIYIEWHWQRFNKLNDGSDEGLE